MYIRLKFQLQITNGLPRATLDSQISIERIKIWWKSEALSDCCTIPFVVTWWKILCENVVGASLNGCNSSMLLMWPFLGPNDRTPDQTNSHCLLFESGKVYSVKLFASNWNSFSLRVYVAALGQVSLVVRAVVFLCVYICMS